MTRYATTLRCTMYAALVFALHVIGMVAGLLAFCELIVWLNEPERR